ncbi:MAG: hypothetical protein CMB64_07375 [Euryarchaeota archaeon]|nr:hypothetical protein [Euryarchaeota archaeon]|tara:strand:- start:221 stop:1564 length:1344 start_codon:yes stop_codon:yes gene_type:complete
MNDKASNEKSFLEKMQYWLREESDMQWVSIAVFFTIIIIGAFFFEHTNVLSGWVRADTNEQGTVLDIDWNEDGTKALAIFSNSGTKSLMSWDIENGWNSITYDAEPNAVDWAGQENWYVGTNDGIEVWPGVGNSSSQIVMNWSDNSTRHRVIDISSIGGISGFIITQSIDGSKIHYFSDTEVSKGTSPPTTGNEKSNSEEELNNENSNSTDDELQQISTNTIQDEGHVQLISVEMIDTERALVIGSSSVFGINPTNALTISTLYDVWASDNENPNLQLIHSKAGVELSQILSLEGSWGDEYSAAVIGPTDCLIINLEGIVSELCEGGGSSGEIDSDGAIWITSATNSLEIKKITTSKEQGEFVSKNLLLPEKYEINSRLAKISGDKIQFYGTNDNGEEVKGTLDPSASQSVLRSLDMLGQLMVFVIAISVFGATAWQFYENRGRSSW